MVEHRNEENSNAESNHTFLGTSFSRYSTRPILLWVPSIKKHLLEKCSVPPLRSSNSSRERTFRATHRNAEREYASVDRAGTRERSPAIRFEKGTETVTVPAANVCRNANLLALHCWLSRSLLSRVVHSSIYLRTLHIRGNSG